MTQGHLVRKLAKERCLECQTCAMFLSSSLTDSTKALFAENDLVIHRHQYILHVALNLGDEGHAIREKEVKKSFVDVSLVQIAAYFLHQGSIFQRLSGARVGGMNMKLSNSSLSLMTFSVKPKIPPQNPIEICIKVLFLCSKSDRRCRQFELDFLFFQSFDQNLCYFLFFIFYVYSNISSRKCNIHCN